MVAPGHTVQFYRDERFLIDSITTFIKGGLDLNETVLVIVTAQHRKELYTTLTSKELRNGKLWFLESHEAFMLFMEEDWPNESQFMNGMERFLRAGCENNQIRVFGELVAVLCAEGKAAAALRLEELWNAFIDKTPLSSVMCISTIRAGRPRDSDKGLPASSGCSVSISNKIRHGVS